MGSQSTALLIMDVQTGIVERFGDGSGLIRRISKVATAARARGVRVIFVKVGFRAGYPEISPRSQTFSQIAEMLSDGCLDGDDEVLRVLCEKVIARQAKVRTVEEWIGALA
jgi:nicotinamidase-related amidase